MIKLKNNFVILTDFRKEIILMKKNDLKQAYGTVPEEFHKTVLNTLNSLDSKQTSKSNKLIRVLIACAIIAVLGTTTVFATSKIYSMIVNKEGNYGLNVEVSSTTGQKLTYPKLNVTNLPNGVVKDFDNHGLLYHTENNNKSKKFSFALYKIKENFKFTDLYITDYEECEINSNKAVIVKKPLLEDSTESFKGFYIYFETEGYLLYCNVSNDVTDAEIKSVMNGVKLTEGTFENHTHSSPLVNLEQATQAPKQSNMTFDYTENYICANQKESIKFESKQFAGTVTLDSIEILDNINTLDREKSYTPNITIADFADKNGNILPTDKGIYQSGDGINSLNKESNKQKVNKKLVLVTFTVTNTTDEDSYIFFGDFYLKWLKNQNGTLSDVCQINPTIPYLSGEMNYLDAENRKPDGTRNSYYYDIPANGNTTFKAGYFVDEDIIDELYITLPKQEVTYQLHSSDESQVFEYIAYKVQ